MTPARRARWTDFMGLGIISGKRNPLSAIVYRSNRAPRQCRARKGGTISYPNILMREEKLCQRK